MNTPTHGADQMAAEIDKVIEAYQRVKARLLECGDALDGWNVCPDPAFNRLFQIHRVDSRKLDAKTVMDVIGGEWVSEQTEWGLQLNGHLIASENIAICIHAGLFAQPAMEGSPILL